jgi:hypothetical protein
MGCHNVKKKAEIKKVFGYSLQSCPASPFLVNERPGKKQKYINYRKMSIHCVPDFCLKTMAFSNNRSPCSHHKFQTSQKKSLLRTLKEFNISITC